MERPDRTVRYEVRGGVAWIVMDRVRKRNAQSVPMTYELNEAFDRAAQDREVKVVVLAADGPHFSAGHDISDPARYDEPGHCVSTWAGWEAPGAEGRLAREHEIYFDMCKRWRDFAKPTIAAVQGKCIGGGLMLAWVCDLIVAAEDAFFLDPVVDFGVGGVEWLAHPWELGPRKAKELLMTAESWTARQAEAAGMVNHVVPADELEAFTQRLAEKIASKPQLAVKLVKQAINAAVDAQGQWNAMQTAFGLHQLAHTHNMLMFGEPMDPAGIPAKVRASMTAAAKDS
ncbi:enoyl-CoA hydratase [Streptomyces sp. NPDC007264]|uniref:enoyl-CoA hydratase n=1 Tax=Streptomyces sp. NPDC007264 TaxID=3364777 RepID=UPI0036D88454